MGIVGSHARLAKKLGRYEIVKHLAQGGMAEVLLARTVGIEGFERHVVLKRIRAEAARDERYVSMFLDEARLAASLHHHNIVQVTDIGQDAGEYFFTMEYIHGEDARTLLANVSRREEHVPLEHAIGIVCAAAAGLHHAHEQRGVDRTPLGLVHRDVSPANILIGYDGGVKVADFGIAKATHRNNAETQSGTLKGKVAYMSPEQCVGEAIDRRSDVFSLGIVLYELCTVRRLFKGENDFLTMTAIVLGYIPPPSTIRPDLPPALEDVILKALANKPKDRYQTAQELRLALEQVAGALGLTILNTALADYMKRVFGTRPEPWLDEDDEPEIEVSVDFDGSRSGVVAAPVEGMAPIETARLVALGSRPVVPALRNITRAAREPEIIEADDAGGELVEPEPEPAPIVEPATTVVTVKRSRARTLLGIAAAVASLCAFALALWISRNPAPVLEEAAVQTTPPPPKPQPPPPKPAPPPAPVVQTVKPEEPKPVVKKQKPSTPAARPQPKKKWNPNSLFLE